MHKAKRIPPQYDHIRKWDVCLDLFMRRLTYSSIAGAFTGLLFCRSPTTRWAFVAFGVGVGLGSAYTNCSYIFNGSSTKLSSSNISTSSQPPPEEEEVVGGGGGGV
ncbi:hypothetical protein Cni_G23041 [Canna indica]|uniref:MICOS complex subunit MIC10 n=1 Tax=Canna indica TaxID=4628 RepID=A0AAQ3KXT5_9LILI|nr:hypothetical protein Cni_G23041 [Canna indica]